MTPRGDRETMNRKSILAIVLAITLVVVACGGRGDDNDNPYVELLRLVPDTPETRSFVLINDYALTRELFNIPLPGPGADEEALEEYFAAFLGTPVDEEGPRLVPGPFISGFHQYAGVSLDRRRYLAFDLRDVEKSVVAGTPPGELEIIRGRFDPQTTDRALSTCSNECTPPDTREEYRGVTFYSWGEDVAITPQKILVPPTFDQVGRGGRIAVQDRYVLRTLGTDHMKSVVDASLNKRPSLADQEDYRLMAQGMTELGAYGMFFTDQTQGFDETLKALCEGMNKQACVRLGAQLEEREPMLRPYQVFATGVGRDEKGSYTALVLVHADETSAKDNLTLLRRRITEGTSLWFSGVLWAEIFNTGKMEVLVEGRVLSAKLRPTEGRRPIWIEWVFQRDPLLLHEPEPGFVLPTPKPSRPVTPTSSRSGIPKGG